MSDSVVDLAVRPTKLRKGSDGGGLILGAEGGIRACLANAMMIMSGSPVPELSALSSFNPWDGVLAFDEFANRPVKRRVPPWLQLCVLPFDPCLWESQDDLYAAEIRGGSAVEAYASRIFLGLRLFLGVDNRTHMSAFCS